MSELTVRRPSFRIDDSVPFQWQPANPAFGLFGNVFTFVAIAFERYIVTATRQAMERISDESVLAEADAFLRQEAQHARAHRVHAKVMIDRYPALQETYAAATGAFDDLLAREPLEFHLAYIADLEATFTPLFRMVLDNRRALFGGADERIGTLLLWHFVEEIEHRSSALVIEQAVNRDRWYRLRQAPKVLTHVSNVFQGVLDGIEEHVGEAACGVAPATVASAALPLGELRARLPVLRRRSPSTMLQSVPSSDLRTMVWHLARSQTPRHDPSREPLPRWADTWHAAYASGADVSSYAGVGLWRS